MSLTQPKSVFFLMLVALIRIVSATMDISFDSFSHTWWDVTYLTRHTAV